MCLSFSQCISHQIGLLFLSHGNGLECCIFRAHYVSELAFCTD
uniref:Uncharacterized protein n=1 Tax=Anguilla anguilla TaxID=7936 RepID=A0A0E9WPX9_ANGAN